MSVARLSNITFSYPEEWKRIKRVPVTAAPDTGTPWTAVGYNGKNVVAVALYRYNVVVSDRIGEARGQLLNALSTLWSANSSWFVQAGPREVKVRGLPGFQFLLTSANDPSIAARFVILYRGGTGYAISCQHTTRYSAAIEGGCDTVLNTLAIVGPDDAATDRPSPSPAPSRRLSVTPAVSVPEPRNGRFFADGVSFDYPSDWLTLNHLPYFLPEGDLRWVVGVGKNGRDWALVAKYSYAGWDQRPQPGLAVASDMANEMVDQSEGHIFENLVGTTVAGHQGFTFTATDGDIGRFTAVMVFGKEAFYVVECHATSFTEDVVERGCIRILKTLEAA